MMTGGVAFPLVAQEDPAAPDPEMIDPAVLEAGPVAQVGLGIGYGTETGLAFSAYARGDGLLGGGHQLGVSLDLGEDSGSIDLDYRYGPLAGRDDLSFGLNLSGISARATDAFAFRTDSAELTPRLIYALSDSVTLSPYLTFSTGRIRDLAAGTSALIAQDAGRRDTIAAGIEGSWRQSDEEAGILTLVQGSFELGSSDRDHDYSAVTIEARHDRLVGAEGNLHLSFGISAGTILTRSGASHIGDRTVLGQSTLRGFDFAGIGPRDLNAAGSPALGGNSYAAIRLEARAPNLFGGSDRARPVPGIFLDAGSLWGLDDTAGGVAGADPVDDGFHLRASVGVMLDLETDYGTFQISIARPVKYEDYDRRAPFNLAYRMAF